MEQKDSPSKKEIESSGASNEIENIDKLATRPPQQFKTYQEDFVGEKLSKTRIAESQESTRGKLAIAIIGIYGSTILFCFAVIGLKLKEKRFSL